MKNDSMLFLFSRLQEELNRVITEFTEQSSGDADSGWSPNIDVVETPLAISLVAELPGIDPATVKLELIGNHVILRGEKRTHYERQSSAEVRFERLERSQGAFRRQVTIDQPVNSSLAEARLEHGVLHVTLPKIEDKRRRVRTLDIACAGDGS